MKKTKRKVVKRQTKAWTDDKSFLIIVAGGFLIVLFGLLIYTKHTKFSSYMAGKVSHNVQENVVVIKDYAFVPETITLSTGEAVVWKNQDKVSHKPTATDNSFTTGTIYEGGEGSYTFSKPGTYTYYSTTYPNVRGTVVVE